MATRQDPPRRGLRRVAKPAIALAAAALAFALAAPELLLTHAAAHAKACLAAYEAPREGPVSDCREHERWLAWAAKAPWTETRARERMEELRARIALGDYRSAIVTQPEGAARAAAVEPLAAAERRVAEASGRLWLSDLGPKVGAPDLGRSAASLGDRATLIAEGERLWSWPAKRAALEAAMREGDFDAAIRLARSYAALDPRDADLRSAVGAVLCLGDDAARGIEMLHFIEENRAKERHAAMARNWGAERAVIVACAARGGITPPALPEGDAGEGDAMAPRVTLWLRLAVGNDARQAELAAIDELQKPRLSAAARTDLIAALLGKDLPIEPEALATLVRMPEADPLRFSAARILAEPPELRAYVSPETYARAAGRLDELASRVEGEDATSLRRAAAACLLARARAFLDAGDSVTKNEAAQAIDAAAERLGVSGAWSALARSTLHFLLGDRQMALDEAERAIAAEGATPLEIAAAKAQKAELLASLGRRDEARASATEALSEAQATGDAKLIVHASFVSLALAAPAAEPTTEPVSWTPSGFASPSWGLSEPWQRDVLSRTLRAYRSAIDASPLRRSALRYEALRARGDAPESLVAYLVAGGELARGAGDVEVWLDAFSALDAPRFTQRSCAFARAEAARLRGDEPAEEAWTKRLRALRMAATDPKRALIASYLGL